MRQPSPLRLRAQRHGLWAERAASAWLSLKGYSVLARDWRSTAGEIDIVARRGRTIAFVEVKYRPAAAAAAEAIDLRKRRRLEGAARAWIAAHPAFAESEMRFDAMLLSPWRMPIHLIDAWRS